MEQFRTIELHIGELHKVVLASLRSQSKLWALQLL